MSRNSSKLEVQSSRTPERRRRWTQMVGKAVERYVRLLYKHRDQNSVPLYSVCGRFFFTCLAYKWVLNVTRCFGLVSFIPFQVTVNQWCGFFCLTVWTLVIIVVIAIIAGTLLSRWMLTRMECVSALSRNSPEAICTLWDWNFVFNSVADSGWVFALLVGHLRCC